MGKLANMALTIRFLKKAERAMLSADKTLPTQNRNEPAIAALHTAIFYLEVSIAHFHDSPVTPL